LAFRFFVAASPTARLIDTTRAPSMDASPNCLAANYHAGARLARPPDQCPSPARRPARSVEAQGPTRMDARGAPLSGMGAVYCTPTVLLWRCPRPTPVNRGRRCPRRRQSLSWRCPRRRQSLGAAVLPSSAPVTSYVNIVCRTTSAAIRRSSSCVGKEAGTPGIDERHAKRAVDSRFVERADELLLVISE